MIEEKLALLNALNIDIDEFYVVTLWKQRLEFQGNLNSTTLQIAKDLGVKLTWNEVTNALDGQNEDIRICLTATL